MAGHPILELGNPNNWESAWTDSKSAAQGARGAYIPIGEMVIPLIFSDHITAVLVESSTAKPSWNFAGFLNQKVRLGLTVGGGLDSYYSLKRKAWLRRITLIRYERLTNDYGLSFEPPKWITQVSIQIWVYTGIETDTITQQLNRIESMLESM